MSRDTSEEGVPVEAELGKIPKIEDYFSSAEIARLRSLSPAEAVRIVQFGTAARDAVKEKAKEYIRLFVGRV